MYLTIWITDPCPTACARKTKLKRTQSWVIKKKKKKNNEQAFGNYLYNSDIYYTADVADVELALGRFLSVINKHAPFKKILKALKVFPVSISPPWRTEGRRTCPVHQSTCRRAANTTALSAAETSDYFGLHHKLLFRSGNILEGSQTLEK